MQFTTQKVMETLAGGPLEDWDAFARFIEVVSLDAEQALFHQGDAHPFVYIVRKGLLKSVYYSADGVGRIKSFTSEGGFIASLAALQGSGEASFTLMANEKAIVERCAYAHLLAFATQRLDWSNMLQRALLRYGAAKEDRERELLTLSPESRYRAALKRADRLTDRISQKDLAAWLGLTPVGLNRIVKRVERASLHIDPANPVGTHIGIGGTV